VRSHVRHLLVGLFALMMCALPPVGAQAPDGQGYSQDELDQLLAPVALDPDQLLMQVLIAATYPLEVVEAARFVQQNPALQGEALDQALTERNWDPSVQSLAAFPSVLVMMSDRLEWTQRLGDAFLVDQQRVMDTAQALRRRAEDAGNLQSTPEESVIAQDGELVIEPVQPDAIYVPVYNPFYVYGPWWAPDFPPWFWYPPPFYGYPAGGMITTGVYFGNAWRVSHPHWGWVRPDWRGRQVHVNVASNPFWNRAGQPSPVMGGTWQHQPGHRHGVAYPDAATHGRYIGADPNAVRARQEFRGHDLAPPAPNAPPASGGGRPRYDTAGQAPTVARPAPNPAVPMPQASRPAPRPAPTPFDPGLSRQQTQINAQRGQQSRQVMVPAPVSPATPAAGSHPPAPLPSPHGGVHGH
jgi:hypothetical protein